jgi:WD40 repeat protein
VTARFSELSPDGKSLLTWTDQGNLQLWDLGSGKLLSKLEGANGSNTGFSPNGLYYASGRKHVEIIEVATSKLLVVLPSEIDTGEITGLAFDQTSSRILVGTRNPNPYLLVYDVATGKRLFSFECGSSDITDVHWIIDDNGKQRYAMALSAIGYEAFVFDTDSKEISPAPAKVFSIGGWSKVSPDGRFIAGKVLRDSTQDEKKRTQVHRVGELPVSRLTSATAPLSHLNDGTWS